MTQLKLKVLVMYENEQNQIIDTRWDDRVEKVEWIILNW